MRVLRLFLFLPISIILSYGLVIIANNFQLFSYLRFGILALYLTPAIFFATLLLLHRFPLPDGWTRSNHFRRQALWLAGLALITSLALTPAISAGARPAPQAQAGQAAYGSSEPYSWHKDYIQRILLVFFLLVGAAGMGVFLYMAPFARMYSDDWCFHTQSLVQGIFAASIDFYLTWSGRFFSNFLVFAGAGSRWTPLIEMILVLASIFTFSYLALSASAPGARQAGSRRSLRILWSLACALAIPFIVFSITPDPYKSLYWIVSSLVVLPFMILIPAYLALAKPLLAGTRSADLPPISTPRAAGYALFAFFLGLFASTVHEVATLPVILLSGLLFGLALFSKRRRPDGDAHYTTLILWLALAGSLLGLIVTFFSPGNAARLYTLAPYYRLLP
jgi:hypothetical protein